MADANRPIIAPALDRRIKRDETALHRVVIDLDTTNVAAGAAFEHIAALVKTALETADRTEQHILSTNRTFALRGFSGG
jgi:hypothetical protein